MCILAMSLAYDLAVKRVSYVCIQILANFKQMHALTPLS